MSMTENEIKESKEWLQDFIRMFGCNFDDLETRSFNKIVTHLEELKQYRTIGTIEEFKALKEKNEPKKQGNINDYESHLRLSKAGFLCCCRTNKSVRYPLISLRDLEYCPCCGQKLDWQ